MSKLTRSGVAYDLTISPHHQIVCYTDDTKTKYVFSSDYYRTMFNDKLEENRKDVSEKLSKRYKLNIEFDKLADIKLYEKVEKRGFLIIEEEVTYRCLDNLKLSGVSKTLKNLPE